MTIESLVGAAVAWAFGLPTGCSTIAGLRAGPSVQYVPPVFQVGRDMVTEERRISTHCAAAVNLRIARSNFRCHGSAFKCMVVHSVRWRPSPGFAYNR